jgi:hypothetical protein
LKRDDAVDQLGQKSLGYDRVFLHELGQVVKSRSCSSNISITRELQTADAGLGGREGDSPMANVRKQKPTTEPSMPTRGKIHILDGWWKHSLTVDYVCRFQEEVE